MRSFISFLVVAVMLLSMNRVSEAGLVITEVMYKPSGTNGGTTGSDEWFEVFNTGYGSVDLGTIKYDDAASASSGILLSSTPMSLAAGQYAIIANKSQANWEARYGALPSGAKFSTISTWQPLEDNFDTMTLYSTVTSSTVFSMTYNGIAIPNGVSIYYSGTNPSLIGNPNPFLNVPGAWQKSPTNRGPATDKHSGGTYELTGGSPLLARRAPEPAAWAMMGIAACGLIVAVRRKSVGVAV